MCLWSEGTIMQQQMSQHKQGGLARPLHTRCAAVQQAVAQANALNGRSTMSRRSDHH